MSIKFIKKRDETNLHDFTDVEITIEDNSVGLDELIEEFENFLKACGYSFRGTLDFINEDEIA